MERLFWSPAILVGVVCAPAIADETVNIGGSRAVLIKPKGAPRGSVILMPGGGGAIQPGENGEILRAHRKSIGSYTALLCSSWLAVLVVDAGTDLKFAVEYMAAIKKPVTVVATSMGTLRAAQGISRGARPDALVLTSEFLSSGSATITM